MTAAEAFETPSGPVGIVLVGHGHSASGLLEAANEILGDKLDAVICVDAGAGETAQLQARMCQAMQDADHGYGVLLVVDLLGASPCNCGLREGGGRNVAVVSGVNLAMVLKLAVLRESADGPHVLAAACADSAKRAITVQDGSVTA